MNIATIVIHILDEPIIIFEEELKRNLKYLPCRHNELEPFWSMTIQARVATNKMQGPTIACCSLTIFVL
jgi:hypothetical protein